MKSQRTSKRDAGVTKGERAELVRELKALLAKSAGRDGWVGIHTQGLQESAELRRRLRTDLRGLVREGHIQVRSSFPLNTVFI